MFVKCLKIIKIGFVVVGVSVLVGIFGYISVNKDINIFIIKISNKFLVVVFFCKMFDIMVKMGD